MLVQYVRNGDKLVGTVVALDKNQIGWSQCNKLDHFSKERGLMIATNRALYGSTVPVGYKVVHIVEKMKERAVRYFKDS